MEREMAKKKDIVKYDNKLNKVSLNHFGKQDCDFFYTICAKVKDKGTNEIELTFAELAELTNARNARHPDRLREDLRHLRERILKTQWRQVVNKIDTMGNLFTTFHIYEEEPKIVVKVNEDFSFLFNEIVNQFTQFELQDFISLQSKYSKRLYVQLKQWKSQGYTPEFSIEMIKEMMGCPNYSPKLLMGEVINPAVQDIRKHKAFENLWVETVRSSNKRGRPIEGYIFHFDKEVIEGQMNIAQLERQSQAKSSKTKKKAGFNDFPQRDHSDEWWQLSDDVLFGVGSPEELAAKKQRMLELEKEEKKRS